MTLRIRNVKNKEEILDSSKYLIKEPFKYIGKYKDLFGNNNPIYLEIGCGKGQFLIENAINNPNINYLGIERFDSIIAKALLKIPSNINNLYIIRMNAIEIEKVFNHEITLMYLNFSDPWPKTRHKERRLTSTTFLNRYKNIFKDNITIIQKTDNEGLFISSIESFSFNNYILSDISFNLHQEQNNIITTEYEDKFIKENKNIYYLKAIKMSK